MEPSSIVDVRSAVISIVQEFSEASELLEKWRNGRVGKKNVGQAECGTSFHEGKSTIERSFKQLSQQHGARFDRGDSKDFRMPIGDTLTL